ncbi:MAG: PaaI family thioesterase [Pseudomonadales bacterium]|nr:PaaI family thioesterase [Pseudomonadales bacterium]
MPLENYFSGDPGFTHEQEAELIRLTNALRGMMDSCVKLNAPLKELQDLADQAEKLDLSMKKHASLRPLAAHNAIFKPEDVAWSSPYSPVVGRANPIAPPMHLVLTQDKAIGTVNFGDIYEGPPDCVHGGIIALTWDHVMALANMLANARGPTAYLNIAYRNPSPLNTELRFEAWIDRIEGKKLFIKGACYNGETVVTEAEGLFINTIIKGLNIDPETIRQQIVTAD